MEYAQIVGHTVPAVITGKPIALGGSLGRGDATARGGFYLLRHLADGLKLGKSLRVAVQGFGNAGRNSIARPSLIRTIRTTPKGRRVDPLPAAAGRATCRARPVRRRQRRHRDRLDWKRHPRHAGGHAMVVTVKERASDWIGRRWLGPSAWM